MTPKTSLAGETMPEGLPQRSCDPPAAGTFTFNSGMETAFYVADPMWRGTLTVTARTGSETLTAHIVYIGVHHAESSSQTAAPGDTVTFTAYPDPQNESFPLDGTSASALEWTSQPDLGAPTVTVYGDRVEASFTIPEGTSGLVEVKAISGSSEGKAFVMVVEGEQWVITPQPAVVGQDDVLAMSATQDGVTGMGAWMTKADFDLLWEIFSMTLAQSDTVTARQMLSTMFDEPNLTPPPLVAQLVTEGLPLLRVTVTDWDWMAAVEELIINGQTVDTSGWYPEDWEELLTQPHVQEMVLVLTENQEVVVERTIRAVMSDTGAEWHGVNTGSVDVVFFPMQEIAEVFASVSSTLTHHNESGIRGSCDSYPEWTLAEATLWVVNVGSVTVRDWINDQTYEIYRAADSSEQNPVLSGWATVTPGTTLSLLAHINPSDAPIWPLQKPMWSGEGVGALEFSDAYGAPLTKVYVDESGSYTIAASSSWPCLIGLWATTPPLALVAVDANNDGVIEFDGSDATSADLPFRFWVGNPTEPLKLKVGDLEDFCLIEIKTPERFWWADFSWRCEVMFTDVTEGDPELELWETLLLGGASPRKYLSDSNAAAFQLNVITSSSPIIARAKGKFNHELGTIPMSAFKNREKATFIFRVTKPGKGKLRVRFFHRDFPAEGGVDMDLKKIEDMFDRVKIPDKQITKPYNIKQWVGLPQPPAWEEASVPITKPPRETRQAIVATHGINESEKHFFEVTCPTLFKRLYWAGYKGRFVGMRWPNRPDPVTFNEDEYYAFVSAIPYKNFIESLKNSGSWDSINVFAHSHGNIMVSEAIRLGQAGMVNNYVLTEAAVPAGCYDTSDTVNNYHRFLEVEARFGGWNKTPDSAAQLGYRGHFRNIANAGASSKVPGNVVSFFNPHDYAIFTGAARLIAWEENQILFKPDWGLSGGRVRYWGNPPKGPRVAWNIPFLGGSRLVFHPYESMSFVARPRSQAIGVTATPRLTSAITLNYDLHYNLEFGAEPSDHSGQINRPIQQVFPYFLKVLDSFDIPHVTPP